MAEVDVSYLGPGGTICCLADARSTNAHLDSVQQAVLLSDRTYTALAHNLGALETCSKVV